MLNLDGEPFKADVAYQKIYAAAQESIIVIDEMLLAPHLFRASEA